MVRSNQARAGWWGEQRLAVDGALSWQIGPLALSVLRGESEWQVAYDWEAELEDSVAAELRRDAPFPDPASHHERYVVRQTDDRIALQPALADRPVVSSPRLPFHLLPGHEISLYVGSPLWVRLEAGRPAVTLRELPCWRPSDTWFGDSTREGELCYATKTRALLNLENLPLLARVAVTPVRIRNRAPDALRLEKLKLPVPLLALFIDRQARLWTESVVLSRGEDEGSEMASLEVVSGPPEEAAAAKLLNPARTTAEPNLWIRAFGGLFGARDGEEG